MPNIRVIPTDRNLQPWEANGDTSFGQGSGTFTRKSADWSMPDQSNPLVSRAMNANDQGRSKYYLNLSFVIL